MLSVIIPVYKVERTLDRCVESVLLQSVPGMEVVLVDDGSPDRCPAMCDAWALRDSRVVVAHKANGGLSDARNAGLDMAKGEYVTFVDSDDWVLPDTYAPIMEWWKEHEECDIVEFPVEHEGTGRLPLRIRDEVFDNAKAYWECTRAWNHAYACNKIYRKRLFASVRYPVGKVFEDIMTLPLLLSQEPVVATLQRGGYHYTWNEQGISVNVDNDARRVAQHLEALLAARRVMRTRAWSRNGVNLYMTIMYRQIDLYRLTGEIVLKCPLARLICALHKLSRCSKLIKTLICTVIHIYK